jgi:hypothetical protein
MRTPRSPEVPLPWERLLWSGRPRRPWALVTGERYVLTDFRLARVSRRSITSPARVDELVLHDVGDVQRIESRLDRLLGVSTLVVHARRRGAAPLVLAGVRHGASLAALLELLAGDPRAHHALLDGDAVRAALSWEPRPPANEYRQALAGFLAMLMAMFGVAIGLHGKSSPVVYAADDALAPNGVKRSHSEIVRFMEMDVMPWARATLGRIVGGPERVSCETCHGVTGAARGWQMPAVAALPQPDLKERGWEIYGGGMDAQMRNAIYGYLADSEKQTKAGYMREVVMPGMARLLHRPAYDFTRSYDYNRSRRALGCYHCHRVD